MLAAAPHDVIVTLANEPVTLNAHHDGITPESWSKHPALDMLYRVVSTNWDKKVWPGMAVNVCRPKLRGG
jgi:hypothetical protein